MTGRRKAVIDTSTGTGTDRHAGARIAGGLSRILLVCLIVLFVAAAAGFVRFSAQVAALDPAPAAPGADGIVVLTGGKARIETALDLLDRGKGRRLLISGVHPNTSITAIRRAVGGDARLFDCCVDIDRAALDTIGNAEETGKWARSHGFSSLIVVTSDYHMPRSLMEMRRIIEGIPIIPHPVHHAIEDGGSWYSDPEALRLVASEYLKYVAASIRLRIRASQPAPALASASTM